MKAKKIIFLSVLLFVPVIFYAQQGGNLVSQINSWRNTLQNIAHAVVALVAIGGGLFTYMKVQGDDGGSGKKAVGNYLFALIFAALMDAIIAFFIP